MGAERDNPRNCLLISMPQLMDPNFFRTVSLMVSFDQNGAFGLILNRPLDVTTGQVFQDKEEMDLKGDYPLFFGGPVQVNSLWFLHGYPQFKETALEVMEGIYLSTDLKVVETVVREYGSHEMPYFRFFLGYAGWAPKQLESEISQSSWVTCPVDRHELFTCDPEMLWSTSLGRIGIHDPASLVSPQTSGSVH